MGVAVLVDAGITSSTSKAAGVFTSKANLSTAVDAWIGLHHRDRYLRRHQH